VAQHLTIQTVKKLSMQEVGLSACTHTAAGLRLELP